MHFFWALNKTLMVHIWYLLYERDDLRLHRTHPTHSHYSSSLSCQQCSWPHRYTCLSPAPEHWQPSNKSHRKSISSIPNLILAHYMTDTNIGRPHLYTNMPCQSTDKNGVYAPPSTLLERLSTRFWSVSMGIFVHSSKRIILRTWEMASLTISSHYSKHF